MGNCFTEFDKSVLDIKGLSEYRPRRIPNWFRQRLIDCSLAELPHDITDEDLVESHVAQYGLPWLMSWGTALIDDETVFLFESDCLTEPTTFAAATDCGLLRVESSEDFPNLQFTMFFTEHPVRRRGQSTHAVGTLSEEISVSDAHLGRANASAAEAGVVSM